MDHGGLRPPDERLIRSFKHIFLINPAAGKGKNQARLAALCRQAAVKFNLDYEILVTEYPGHGVELVQKALSQSGGRKTRIYACGGDGTLNEAARGAFDAWNASITQFPAGTGNDFIRLFGPQMSAYSSLEAVIQGKELSVDYMEANCGGAVNVMSVGVDARVAAGMKKYKKLPLPGEIAPYALSAVENVIRGLGERYQVEIDGARYDGEYSMVFMGNGRYYGGGFCPVPDADPQDGLLDVLLVSKVSRLTAARVVSAYKRGLYKNYPQYIRRLSAKRIQIRLQDGGRMCVNMDGEIAYTDRLEVRLLRGLPFTAAYPIQQFFPPKEPEAGGGPAKKPRGKEGKEGEQNERKFWGRKR